MKLLVLAGGFGTRLQGAVAGVPKALAPVGSTAFLHLQIEHWVAQGITEFVFLLHHQADQIISFLQANRNGLLRKCQVAWTTEPSPLDTGGAVAYAVHTLGLNGDVLITNADTWLGKGVDDLQDVGSPSLAVIHLSDISRYGEVLFDQDLRVNGFKEKCGRKMPGWINAGLCRLSTELFSYWDGRALSLERTVFPNLVHQGALQAVPVQTDFIDIGVPDDYARFCMWASNGRREGLL